MTDKSLEETVSSHCMLLSVTQLTEFEQRPGRTHINRTIDIIKVNKAKKKIKGSRYI